MEQSSVISNWNRIGSSLNNLERLYIQTLQTCQGLNPVFPGIGNRSGPRTYSPSGYTQPPVRPATFIETMEEIRVFMKLLSGENLTNVENDIVESVLMQDYLHWFELEGHINEYTQWLTNVLTQCFRTQSGIRTAQNLILQDRYAPGGTLFQQAQQRNTGTFGMGL